MKLLQPTSGSDNKLIEALLVLHGDRVAIEEAVTENQLHVPEIFRTADGPYNLPGMNLPAHVNTIDLPDLDLNTVFVDDESYNYGHGHAYDNLGINPQQGAVVIVRPDQYVSMVTSLEDSNGICEFFKVFTAGRQS
jgi:phenol 2-monooxygenase